MGNLFFDRSLVQKLNVIGLGQCQQHLLFLLRKKKKSSFPGLGQSCIIPTQMQDTTIKTG